MTRTPFRVSLCGGGTDIRTFFEKAEGMVVGGAIDAYSYISVRRLPPFHPHKTRVVYNAIETVRSNLDIQHRAVNAAVRMLGMEDEGLEIFHQADLPGRSGTGSSSSFAVGLLNGLASLKGDYLHREALARAAVRLEREELGESGGLQDQYFAAHGGLAVIRFRPSGVTFEPLPLLRSAVEELNAHLLLFFSGVQRTSSEVAASYVPTLGDRKDEMWALVRLADQCADAVLRGQHERLGQLIDQSWRIKAGLSPKVCPPDMAALYGRMRLAGAWGGKLTGAGGGGCWLLVAPPEKRAKVIGAAEEAGAIHVPFSFDWSGSTVIYADGGRS